MLRSEICVCVAGRRQLRDLSVSPPLQLEADGSAFPIGPRNDASVG